ncbi:MAG: MBL fold metallo-hydrolase [Deltaproteobacteria bacterium]|nr:MBL fold metallo-hydrolase [Deltaproteobacteria bacterium]MBN2688141.1 MBL fold metallo-hydrolase [Deltaproteobacteria bacterium]
MRNREAGKICQCLWYLGRPESGVYLLEGSERSMIINGGLSCILPDVLRQIEEFGIDERRIDNLLILHGHFDHVGIVPFFKRRNPNLKIFASKRAWEILAMPHAISTINRFSDATAQRLSLPAIPPCYDVEWRTDVSGEALSEGDSIDLGSLRVSILETPGHSSCSLAAYVPEIEALFPSDSGGIPFKNIIVSSGNSNYTQYQNSLEKMSGLNVEYYCADHYGYVTGMEASSFIERSIDAAQAFRRRMESAYVRTGSINSAVGQMMIDMAHELDDYVLPGDIIEGIYGQMVKHIAMVMDEKP